MTTIKPMLATSGTKDLLDRKDHYFEAKLDGIRALCYKKTKLKFTSRNGIVITDTYPEFDFFDNIDCEECILDGEIVVYDEKGHPSFSLWAERDKGKNSYPATYVVFDILFKDGESLMNEPLYVRKKMLDKMITEGDHLQLSLYTKKGHELWKLALEKGIEGVIAKKDDSSYELGARSDSWRKIKNTQEVDCVILGFTSEKRKLTSLALGLYDSNNELQFVGKVGTGFDEKMMDSLREKLDGLVIDSAIVETESGVTPVEPILVCEVNYLEFTKHNKIRAPVFVRLREDKDLKDCVFPK